MDSYRKQQSQSDEATYESQKNTKPMSVPFWDQKFCWTVGSVPWEKLLETKKNMHRYKDAVQWNDSAAEEAFNYKIDGLPCYIQLPNPDAYIAEIEWSNPRISTGLELVSNDQTQERGEGDVVIDDLESLSDQSSSCTGWMQKASNESDEDSKEDDNSSADNEGNVHHKEAADKLGFESTTWNKPDYGKNKMVQDMMMGLIWESTLW
ncbi:uncharacterized protein LOC126793920 [Argentina anserina]|uniref:uncharacterized protein LOC126793920 n=1 Tax=Argentina anserina TaxID=57926 RepID=UPI00217657BF|nr:uncharacterized protein LOC126793920 [Potentilla anserina]